MKTTTKFSFVWIWVIFISFSLKAQDFSNYEPLKSKGIVPEKFLASVSTDYLSKKDSVQTTNKKTAKKLDNFNLQSSFFIKQLLWSGDVVFGDTVSLYLNQIADELLKNNVELRQKVRFYVVKSQVVNAFATPDGDIFITLGLIAKAENEAQLAYILAHEVTHYVKKHSLNQFLYKTDKKKRKKDESGKRFESKSDALYARLLAQSNYSKQHEIEADEYGWELFQNSSYRLEEVPATFDMLQNANKPIDTLVFESKFLNNSYIKLPDSVFYKDTIHFVEKEKLDSVALEKLRALSTHPSAAERKKLALQRLSEKTTQASTQKYIISKEQFELSQQIARFELLNNYLSNANYIDALYNTLVLQTQYGDSKFLQLSLMKALYGIAKYDNEKAFIYLEFPYGELDWKGRNWFFALEELESHQLTVLALAHAFELLDKYPEEQYLNKIIPSLLMDMKVHYNDFTTNAKNKYDNDLLRTTWEGLSAHAKFVELDKKAQGLYNEYQKNKTRIEEGLSDEEIKQIVDNRAKGYALGINKIVLTNPMYAHINKKGRIDIIQTDLKQKELNQMLKEESQDLKLDLALFTPSDFDSTDAEKFNELAIINAWYREMGDSEVGMITSNYDELNKLVEKYNTPYFARMRLSQEDNRYENGYLIYGGIFLLAIPPISAYAFYKYLHNYDAVILTAVFNVSTGKVEMLKRDYRNKRMSSKTLSDLTHSHLNQIKRKKR